MIVGIKIFLGIFGMGLLFVVLPIVALFWLLGLLFESAWVRVPLALLILMLIIASLPSPHVRVPLWRVAENEQLDSMRRIGGAWVEYKTDKEASADWEHTVPERFSQLFPDHLAPGDARIFFNPRERERFEDLWKKAAADITEVDRESRFDYFAGKVGWMVAASKAPLEAPERKGPNAPVKKYRVILEIDGSARIWPEEEYQRRLQFGPTRLAPGW